MKPLISEQQEKRTRNYEQRTSDDIFRMTKTVWRESKMKHTNGHTRTYLDAAPEERYGVLESIGPAIDDEETAAYISHFLAADDYGEGYDIYAQSTPDKNKTSRQNGKAFVDTDSTYLLAEAASPAIDDEATARHMASFLQD